MEDIEQHETRAPGDIDVVTFVGVPLDPFTLRTLLNALPGRFTRAFVKATYRVDHMIYSLGSKGELLVDQGRYWYGLFSHRRDRHWKGMLRVPFGDAVADSEGATIVSVTP